MNIKAYLVGGYVRDKILGQASKDMDYSVTAPSYDAMVSWIEARGKIFQQKPEYLTVRAKIYFDGQPADFVLARADGTYRDGRRPESVSPGTIYDDLRRRDFTMNAIAMDPETGEIIDPHGGREDIRSRLIRCVGDARERFAEDALRMLRALRFSVTKRMHLDVDILNALLDRDLIGSLRDNVSADRKRDELTKAFAADTVGTMRLLMDFSGIRDACLGADLEPKIWLMPTTRTP